MYLSALWHFERVSVAVEPKSVLSRVYTSAGLCRLYVVQTRTHLSDYLAEGVIRISQESGST